MFAHETNIKLFDIKLDINDIKLEINYKKKAGQRYVKIEWHTTEQLLG